MNKHSTFSVAHLRMHADELIAAVQGSHEVLVIADHGAPKAVLQDIRSFQSLLRAVNILEKLVAERADAIEDQRAEINDVLEQLRVIH
jgi:prevent-host-death family protein